MADYAVAEQVIGVAEQAIRQQGVIARIERLPFHRWHVKMRLIVGSATFFDALDALMIAYILPVLIGLWHIKPTQIGLLISSGYVGQLLGALFFGWLAERKGRLFSLAYSITVFSLASFLCMLSWSYGALFAFRFIQGCGLGGEVPVAATYVNEMAKAKGRGRFVVLYETVFSVGMLAASLLSWWVLPRFGWKVMFLIGAVIGLVVPVLRRQLPESPRWLAGQRRFDEAEKIVSEIESAVSEKGKRELPPVRTLPNATELRRTHWPELFHNSYLRRTMTVWVLWFCASFCYFGIAIWLPSLYISIYKLPLKTVLQYGFIVQLATLIAALVSALIIDKIGRIKLFTGCFAITVVAIAILLLSQGSKPSPHALLVLSCTTSFMMAAVSTCLWLYTPEVYPTRMRALGSSLGAMWGRASVIVAPMLVGIIVSRYSVAHIFAMFGVVAAIGGIITALFAVETRERILEEVSP